MVSERALRGEEDVFELWAEHVDAFEVFAVCRRQWRLAVGMGGAQFLSLESHAVDSAMRDKGLNRSRRWEVRQQLLVMEDEGLKVLNAQ